MLNYQDTNTDTLVQRAGQLQGVQSLSMPRGNVLFGLQFCAGSTNTSAPTGTTAVWFGLKATSDMKGPWLANVQLQPIAGSPGLYQATLPVNTPEMIAATHADPADPVAEVTALPVYGQVYYFLPGVADPNTSQLINVTITPVLWNGAEGIAPSPNIPYPTAAAVTNAIAQVGTAVQPGTAPVLTGANITEIPAGNLLPSTVPGLSSTPIHVIFQPGGQTVPPAAGNVVILADIERIGPGVITMVQMSMDAGQLSFDARLQILVDGETVPSFDVDLGTLFCSHLDATAVPGRVLSTEHICVGMVGTSTPAFGGHPSQVSYAMYFPVPYSQGCVVQIYNPGVASGGYNLFFSQVTYRSTPLAGALRLRSLSCPLRTAPTTLAANSMPFFDLPNAAGWLVWASIAVTNATDYTYLERPWTFHIDGEAGSSFGSDGAEDFFGGTGWYFAAAPSLNTPHAIVTANQNANHTTVAGLDLLKLHGGIKFTNRLKAEWDNKPPPAAQADTNHSAGWCFLYYADTSVPFAPSSPAVQAAPGAAQLTIAITPPVSPGSGPLTGYTATLTPGNVVVPLAPAVTSYTFTGLTNGTAYTVSLVAVNAVGNSVAVTATGTPAGDPEDVLLYALTPLGYDRIYFAARGPKNAEGTAAVNGDSVSLVSDTSGNGHDTAAQSDSTAQPLLVTGALNGRPVLRFDGSNDYLQSPLTLSDQAMTVQIVARRVSATVANAGLFGMIVAGQPDYGASGCNVDCDPSGNLQFQRNGDNLATVSPFPAGAFLLTIRINIDVLDVWLNGTQITTGVVFSNPLCTFAALLLGCRATPGASYFGNHDIGFVAVTNHAMSDADRASSDAAIRSYFGL